MRVDRRALTALTLALALTPAAGAHAATQTYVALFYDEDMQGAAQSLLFTPADSSITLQRSGRTGRGTDAAEFDVQRDSNEFWDLDFYSPDVGVPLRPGVYDQTGPTGSAPRARLHVGGSHGGCEPDAGRFEIKDVAPDAAGNIGRLWAIFEYHCGDENPWARFGEIKFNEPAAETGIEAQPSVMRWPAAEFGYKRANVVVTLRAASASRITGVRIDGSEAGDYAVHDDGCSGVSLGAGATCRIGLGFAPRVPGTRLATLHVATAAGQVLDVPLQGFTYGGTTRAQFTGGPAQGTETYAPGNASVYAWGGNTHVHFDVRGDNGAIWSADFTPGQGDALRPGTYENAARYPFNGSQPGMDVNGRGSGCNTVSGHFTVTDATYNRYGEVRSFGVDYVQYCDEQPDLEWRGSLAWRAGSTTPPAPWMEGGAAGSAAPSLGGSGSPTSTVVGSSGTGAPAGGDGTSRAATPPLSVARRLRAGLTARTRLVFTLPAGRLRVSWWARGHVLARGVRTWRRAGRQAVVLHLTRLGRRELRRHRRLRVRVTASFRRASGGAPIVVSTLRTRR